VGAGAAEGLAAALAGTAAVDHHAHPLAGPGARPPLARIFTEAADPAQLAEVHETVAWQRGVADLALFLGAAPEEALARDGFEAHTRRLLAGCGLGEILVDDGYRVAGALGLDALARLAGVPVRRIVRIEAAAEAAASGWPPWADVLERFRSALAGAPALKTIAAYRGGLDLPVPAGPQEAALPYEEWRRSGSSRLTDPRLVSLFLAAALDAAAARRPPPPLQVHVGLGDRDLALHRSDPSLLRPWLEEPRWAAVPVVLLHCYPFVRQAAYLAAVHPQVHLDLSLALAFTPHGGTGLVLEALDLAPATRLLFATDAWGLPEMYWLASRRGRQALVGALAHLVDSGLVTEATALRWGRLVLAGNAHRLYGASAAGAS
jgi:hypothetical protein